MTMHCRLKRGTTSMILSGLLALVMLLAPVGFGGGAAQAHMKKNLQVKILAFNDFHGQLSPKTVSGRPAGGAAVLASYLKDAQAGMEDRTFIVSAGDFVGASPANSALLQDEPSIMVLNTLANRFCSHRMDPRCNVIATVGNHEFDEGVSELKRLIFGGNHEDGPFLQHHYRGARYPYVVANVIDEATGDSLLKPYVIRKAGNVPIAFIGAVLKDTPNIVAPAGVAGLSFLDEADAINSYVPEIRAMGVKAIVAVIHQGGNDVTNIISHLNGEIDVVISGHAHQLTNTTVNNAAGKPVLVTQAYSAGTAYADIDLEIDPRTRDIVAKSATVPTTWGDAGPGLKPDKCVAAIVAAADAAVEPYVNVVVGSAGSDISRTQNSSGESALGNLIADAQRRYEGTDFAFMNPGGIRADITAGEVTWGELFAVQPFGNQMVRMTLTGQQIYDLLAQQWANPASPKMLQISGLSYLWTDNGTGVAGTVSVVMKDGIPIDKTAAYTVTTNNFLAGGGDGFTVFKSGQSPVVDAADIDVLVSYIQSLQQPFSAAIEGRTERIVPPVINAPSVNAEAARALSQPFTIAAIPDTQMYADDSDPAVTLGFQKQIDWVLANAGAQNILFVTHLGDVVDNGTDTTQWAKAMSALNPLLGQDDLPFSIVRGNHDEPTFFLKNIPVSTMAKKPWFVGSSSSGLTQAQLFTVEGLQILHIGFQKDPTADEIAWANALLAKPNMNGLPVIVSTHDYIDGSGQSVTGRMIWDGFVKNNPMVFMVLNGHTHTEYALINHDVANRPVYQMLSDYQDRANGGNGLMRLVTIDPTLSKIAVKTFSPYYNKADANTFETDADSQFEYDVNVKERLANDTTFDFGEEPPAPPLPPLNAIPASVHYTHIFQNRRPLVGTDTPYAGTVDVQMNENNATLNYGGEATLTTDMDDNGSRVHALLRFDNIIGDGPGQIPPGSRILSANLVFSATSSTKGKVIMHRMLKPWGEHSSWMDFTPKDANGQPTWTSMQYLNTDTGIYRYITLPHVMVDGGVQPEGIEAAAEADLIFTMPKPVPVPFILTAYGTTYQAPAWDPATGAVIPKPALETLSTTTAGLTATVQAWIDGTAANWGWFFEPTSSDGWDFETAEGKQPPALVVEVEGAQLVQ
ncbi:MAG: 5'-nucleotidase C-terminal domain-containing protein [Syntrophobacteraceae bacterium]